MLALTVPSKITRVEGERASEMESYGVCCEFEGEGHAMSAVPRSTPSHSHLPQSAPGHRCALCDNGKCVSAPSNLMATVDARRWRSRKRVPMGQKSARGAVHVDHYCSP